MIEVLVDPGAYDTLDVGEVHHHPPIVERWRFDGDHSAAVVAMQVAAFAVVVQESMAVTEIDFA